MSMSSNVAHGQSTNPWGSSSASSLSSSLTDTFGQSRTHYQPGYMMVSHPNQSPLLFADPLSQSAQQHHVHAPQNAQHADEIPTVQTKAKMNLALSRGGAPHFGADSMFESASTSVTSFCSRRPIAQVFFFHAGNGRHLQIRMHLPPRPYMTCFGSHPLVPQKGRHQECVAASLYSS